MSHSPVVQATNNLERQVREIGFRVPEHILGNARAFDTSNGMFNPDSDPRDATIRTFLAACQLTFAWLFFGWYV